MASTRSSGRSIGSTDAGEEEGNHARGFIARARSVLAGLSSRQAAASTGPSPATSPSSAAASTADDRASEEEGASRVSEADVPEGEADEAVDELEQEMEGEGERERPADGVEPGEAEEAEEAEPAAEEIRLYMRPDAETVRHVQRECASNKRQRRSKATASQYGPISEQLAIYSEHGLLGQETCDLRGPALEFFQFCAAPPNASLKGIQMKADKKVVVAAATPHNVLIFFNDYYQHRPKLDTNGRPVAGTKATPNMITKARCALQALQDDQKTWEVRDYDDELQLYRKEMGDLQLSKCSNISDLISKMEKDVSCWHLYTLLPSHGAPVHSSQFTPPPTNIPLSPHTRSLPSAKEPSPIAAP